MPLDPRRILYEDQWLLAVNKLGGELVVKGKGKVQKLPLLDFLKTDRPALFPIHRLDYETSGIVVFAKTRAVLKSIVQSKFAGWVKTYEAIVLGTPKKPADTISIALPARSGEGKVAAETKYTVKQRMKDTSLVELSFERGQRHQIRRHMAAIGCPLILDDRYGVSNANKKLQKYLKMHRFFLHASTISFPHPVTKETVHIQCAKPDVFMKTIEKLK
jgi:23S rRNA-/tRNA-specific pseudouridylate synthase